jgi:serine protease
MAWKNAPFDKFIILEYKITNPTKTPITNFYFGQFVDWNVSQYYYNNFAAWMPSEKVGYVYGIPPSTTVAGTQLLTGNPIYYALDNEPAPIDGDIIEAGPFNVNYYFPNDAKFTTLTTQRLTAGLTAGNDVSNVVSSGPYIIPPGQTLKLAFALHAANSLADLTASAKAADSLYNTVLNIPLPQVDTSTICYQKPVSITASGGTNLKWYTALLGGTSFFTGKTLTTNPLTSDTTFYVSNADNALESDRAPAVVLVRANPKISSTADTLYCKVPSITLSVDKADSYLWSTKETTQSIQVSSAGTYSVSVKDNTMGCSSVSENFTTVALAGPTAKFTTSGNLVERETISFIDQSINAVSWIWNFGDETVSYVQNPKHYYITYAGIVDFNVILTVTDARGCTNQVTSPLPIIAGLEDASGVSVYPNPVHGQPLMVELTEPAGATIQFSMLNLLGESFYQKELSSTGQKMQQEIKLNNVPNGVYILRVNAGDHYITKKIIKAD